MADDNSYILPSNDSQNEESSDEAISEIVQIHEIRNPESASQTSAPPVIQHKSQTKSSWKQIERLIKVQKDSGYEEQLHLIQDISTRWNSSYLAWDRLIFLQYAILQLNINLSCSFIREEKADGISNLDEEDINDETINSDDLEENLTDQQINYDNIREVLENVKKNIYKSLKHYWAIPHEFGIMAALLDPRYKSLDFISEEDTKKRIHSRLREKYDQLKWDISQQSIPSSPTTTITSTDTEGLIAESSSKSSTPGRSLRDHRARQEQKTKEVFQQTEKPKSSVMEDEITSYFLMPTARENKNPLDWWRAKREIFPILSLLAQKYLGIPATSVSSERLFSDAGNHIRAKRNSLDPDLLGKMIFLKRNMQTMEYINVFPPDLNVEKEDFIEEFLPEFESEE
ncbi:unnamed protein product [Rhizophagus irregularis]|nr:unnamed protein product [Rhizophagus irregularis]